MYTTLAWIPAALFVFVNHRSPLQDRHIIHYNNSWLLCFSKHKNNNKKKHFSFYPPSLSFSILSLLFHISYLPSVFIQYFSPFLSLPLSFHRIHVLDPLSLLVAHSAPSILSFPSIPVFSLLIPTSKSRHHFSCTLSPQVLRNFLSYSLLCLDSLIFSLLSFLSVSLPLSLSSAFIHFPFVLNLFTPSLTYPFLW
jgi:hypothetical protein